MLDPQALRQELLTCQAAGTDGRVSVRVLQAAPYLAVGRDFLGRAAIMLSPLPEAAAFRTPSVEFLPTAHLEFDGPTLGGAQECTLVLFDEAGLGGVLRELMPVLIWGLYDSLVQGGSTTATAYASVLALMLRGEGEIAEPEAVQGLWAELLVIAYSSDPAALVEAWHEDPDEIYDFALGSERLEVKSTRGAHRRHHFSSAQLPPRAGLKLTVVSVLVQRVAGGSTLFDLLQRVRQLVPASVATAVLQKTLAVVPISALSERAYDAQSASATVLFVAGADVPCINLPRDVLSASWTADLANLSSVPAPSGLLDSAARTATV